MINDKYSIHKQLENINPVWNSNSRIYGQAIEDWVIANYKCSCGSFFESLNANSKSIDGICSSCGRKIQIKSSSHKFKPNKENILKILGAEYKTTLNSVTESDWDLILVAYCKNGNKINQILKVDSSYIKENSVLPRKPLASTARRAGWQGCYLIFNWESVDDVYL